MSDIGWVYYMTSFVTTIIAAIVVVGYFLANSNKQAFGHHMVDTMAGDEGED